MYAKRIIIIIQLVKVSSPRVSSGSASQTTLRRRSSELLMARKRVSGGDEVAQMCNEVKVIGKEDRERLVEELRRTTGCFKVEFSVSESLGIQSVLSIPYNKLRIMKRYIVINTQYHYFITFFSLKNAGAQHQDRF